MTFSKADLLAQAKTIKKTGFTLAGSRVSDLNQVFLFPGFFDVHVHFREPGFSYKETIFSGSRAAAHGGYTGVCSMPNLNPVPDSLAHLREEQDIIERDACIAVLPYASVTVGEKGQEITDVEALAPHCFAFSDDGVGIQNEATMREAMRRIRKTGKILAAHCEVNELLHGGYIHDGVYAKEHGHKGICSASEWKEIERDVALAAETGCPYHVCHVSTKESLAIIRKAKADGIAVTCETAPHYLLMDDSMLQEEGRFKMNPPIRGKEDYEALLNAVQDGTIDMIATDHAPHSAEEKSRGLEKSPFGIVGLETAFPLLYTNLVKKGVISLEKLIDLMAYAPRRRFQIPLSDGDFCVYDLSEHYEIDPADFLSQGKATPFTGWPVYGKCLLTVHDGKVVWQDPSVTLTD
ncbi:MAG TPA: dihydroorotase [Clostridiales bacterium]|nr:dihydroorotase [Clostridiales bacterium]